MGGGKRRGAKKNQTSLNEIKGGDIQPLPGESPGTSVQEDPRGKITVDQYSYKVESR